MNSFNDEKIVDSWEKNVLPWTAAVREGQIQSRALLTDQAIVESVLSHSPESVLDIGCGEGWLIRALAPQVRHLVGVDVVAGLIAHAKAAGGGDFIVASYESIGRGAVVGQFDIVVCNFSMLGKESVDAVFSAIPALLKPGGVFIVQTLHPVFACADLPYVDGWREGSWTGFSADFIDPAPWYFRTIESWVALFSANGLVLLDLREPIHPTTHKPASVIFKAMTAPISADIKDH